METRPWLAKLPNRYGSTPMHHALLSDRVGVLRVLLEHDSSLGYVVAGTEDVPLLVSAAFQGRIGIAREILSYCPDAPFRSKNGWTCLSAAVHADRLEFVEFVLGTPELQKLVSMRDNQGRTALHYAVMKCNPKIVAALLSHGGADVTMLDNSSSPPSWKLWGLGDHTKTLNWVCYSLSQVLFFLNITSAYNIINHFDFGQSQTTTNLTNFIHKHTNIYTVAKLNRLEGGAPPQYIQWRRLIDWRGVHHLNRTCSGTRNF